MAPPSNSSNSGLPTSLDDVIDVNEYTGRAAIHRLMYIANHPHAQSIAKQALLAVIPLIKAHTLDTSLYGSVVTRLVNMSDGMDLDAPPKFGMEFDASPALSTSAPASTSFSASASFPGPSSLSSGPRSRLPAGAGNPTAHLEAAGGVDSDWIDAATKKASTEGMKLESELKGYMSNLIKESCRLTYHSLANHHVLTGDLQSALKALSKAREYNSSPQHELDCSLPIIEISLVITPPAYSATLPAVVKAEYALSRIIGAAQASAGRAGAGVAGEAGMTLQQTRDRDREREVLTGTKKLVGLKCKVGRGVCGLGASQWEAGGKELGAVEGKLDDWEGRVFASSDVAIYTAFLMLATQSRAQLRTNFLENDNMRHYLDNGSAGYVRDLIDCFVEARYGAMLEILRKNYWRHALDPYLGPKLNDLTNLILQKSYIQYFQPFQQVTFARMAEAFGYVTDETEKGSNDKDRMIADVVSLVERGRMQARIDMIDMVLQAVKVDQRGELYKNAMDIGKKVDAAVRKSHLRMNLIENKILVEDSRKKGKKSATAEQDDAEFSPNEMDADDTLMDLDDGPSASGGALVSEDVDLQLAVAASLESR